MLSPPRPDKGHSNSQLSAPPLASPCGAWNVGAEVSRRRDVSLGARPGATGPRAPPAGPPSPAVPSRRNGLRSWLIAPFPSLPPGFFLPHPEAVPAPGPGGVCAQPALQLLCEMRWSTQAAPSRGVPGPGCAERSTGSAGRGEKERRLDWGFGAQGLPGITCMVLPPTRWTARGRGRPWRDPGRAWHGTWSQSHPPGGRKL